MKALIAYGTKYGATASTSEEIGRILRERGFEVKVVDLKAEKIRDISEYGLIAIGSALLCILVPRILPSVGTSPRVMSKCSFCSQKYCAARCETFTKDCPWR